MTRRRRSVQCWSMGLLVFALGTMVLARQTTGGRWVTGWGLPQYGLGTTPVSNTTVRMIARVTVPGESIRLRLDNTYGTAPVSIGKVSVGWRQRGGSVFPGTTRPVLFNGSPTVSIPAAGSVESDPVQIQVRAMQDLAVSLFVPGTDVRPSQHNGGLTTSYIAPDGSGDLTATQEEKPFSSPTPAVLWLKSIDVLSPTASGGIVAFGDSITYGTCATRDGYDRWPDWLALRLDLAGRRVAVVNEGIGGNTILREHPEKIPPTGMPGLDRLERDVLSHKGMTHVVLFMGTNDMRRSATAAQVRGGMEEIIKRVKARGMRIIGGTAIPRHNNANPPWDANKTKNRNELNEWIRTKAPFDGVIDFDRLMRDPSNPDLINPALDCDGIHPNIQGYYEIGRSLALDLFQSGGGRGRSR
jgi:lysophospholipase L1-like esterase